MLWQHNIAGLVLALFTLASCDFKPIYAKPEAGGGVSAAMRMVRVETNPDRLGQILKSEMEDHLSPTSEKGVKEFVLKAGLNMETIPLLIEPDGTASRYNVILHSPYRLVRLADQKEIAKGEVKRVISYGVSENADFATAISQQDAIKRGVAELAADYQMRVAAALGGAK